MQQVTNMPRYKNFKQHPESLCFVEQKNNITRDSFALQVPLAKHGDMAR